MIIRNLLYPQRILFSSQQIRDKNRYNRYCIAPHALLQIHIHTFYIFRSLFSRMRSIFFFVFFFWHHLSLHLNLLLRYNCRTLILERAINLCIRMHLDPNYSRNVFEVTVDVFWNVLFLLCRHVTSSGHNCDSKFTK